MTPPDRSPSRPFVLLVEDEVLVRVMFATMLEKAGFRVLPVTSAEEALAVLAGIPDIEAVVTDAQLLPDGMNGFELARRIKDEQGPGVIVVSGRLVPDQDALPEGVHFLAKPVHQTTLVHLVQNLTSQAKARKPARAEVTAPAGEAGATRGHALTPRQRQVLELLVQGKPNRDIAQALALSEHTVKVHLSSVFRSLGVSTRLEAIVAGRSLLPHP